MNTLQKNYHSIDDSYYNNSHKYVAIVDIISKPLNTSLTSYNSRKFK